MTLSYLQNSTANSGHLTAHFCPALVCLQKATIRIQLLPQFHTLHTLQVDMQNVVKSSQHFFGYFNLQKLTVTGLKILWNLHPRFVLCSNSKSYFLGISILQKLTVLCDNYKVYGCSLLSQYLECISFFQVAKISTMLTLIASGLTFPNLNQALTLSKCPSIQNTKWLKRLLQTMLSSVCLFTLSSMHRFTIVLLQSQKYSFSLNDLTIKEVQIVYPMSAPS